MKYSIAPSILAANFLKLDQELKKVEIEEVDYIHIDVMDGSFVPNITIGASVVADIKKIATKKLDVHLMIENPEKHIDDFIKAGANILTFHLEATKKPQDLLKHIKDKGIIAGVSIKPETSLSVLDTVYNALDLVLVMTVNPGFGGQKLITSVLPKMKQLSEIKKDKGYNFIIEVDGGVTIDNVDQYINNGAELIVAGNAVFGAKDPAAAIRELLNKGKK